MIENERLVSHETIVSDPVPLPEFADMPRPRQNAGYSIPKPESSYETICTGGIGAESAIGLGVFIVGLAFIVIKVL